MGRQSRTTIVFLIGCGRSGTHWLARTIEAHKEMYCTVEEPEIFRRVTAMALDAGLTGSLFPELVSEYQQWQVRAAPKLYLDKSHPNLWLADRLFAAFPESSFLGIERDPFATVSSMLQHDGVRRWCETWRDFPIPNRFLGITSDNLAAYAEMSVTQRCALRWRAHHDEMSALRDRLGPRLLTVRYDDLERQPTATVARLTRFLGLSEPIPLPEPPAGPPDKWRSLLSAEQIGEIEVIVGL